MDAASEAIVASMLGRHRSELDRLADGLRSYLELRCVRLRDSIQHVDFRFRFVERPRVKELPSIVRAMNERELRPGEIWNIDDLVGARVVVVSSSDARLLAAAISDDSVGAAPLCPATSLHSDEINDDRTGYRALHLKGAIRTSFGTVGAEIQIRTALEDAWAVVSRADLYKTSVPSEPYVQMMRIQAQHLAAADEAFELVRRQSQRAEPASPIIVEKNLSTDDAGRAAESLEVARSDGTAGPDDRLPDTSLAEEEFIIATPLSDSRRASFLSSYLEDRNKASTLEKLFGRVGRFNVTPERNDDTATGVDTLLEKGPFVDGSNWLVYETWDFAIALERHLLSLFNTSIHENASQPAGDPVEGNWRAMLDAVDRLLANGAPGTNVSLIVVAGHLSDGLLPAPDVTPSWELPEDLRGIAMVGAYKRIPIVHVRDPKVSALSVVDLRRFASLTKYGLSPEFELRELTPAEITDFVTRAAVAGPAVEQSQLLRRARMLLRLRLFESHSIDVADASAVASVPLLGAG